MNRRFDRGGEASRSRDKSIGRASFAFWRISRAKKASVTQSALMHVKNSTHVIIVKIASSRG